MTTILCYGDSNTYGYNPVNGLRYPKDVRWTGVLQKLLGEQYAVIEEGCNGRTTVFEDIAEPWKAGLGYLKPCLNTHKPIDFVIMMLGSNDLKRMFHASAKEIADGAEQLVSIIKEFTKEKQGFMPKVILVSPPEIGADIATSEFARSFDEDAIERSKELPVFYEKIQRVGAFAYSPEEGTPAAKMLNRVDTEEAKRRAELVMEVQSQVMDQFNDSRMGDTVEVLCDGWDGQSMSYVGRSYAESPGIDGNIYFTSDQPVEAGDFVRVRITGAMDGELTGERTEE